LFIHIYSSCVVRVFLWWFRESVIVTCSFSVNFIVFEYHISTSLKGNRFVSELVTSRSLGGFDRFTDTNDIMIVLPRISFSLVSIWVLLLWKTESVDNIGITIRVINSLRPDLSPVITLDISIWVSLVGNRYRGSDLEYTRTTTPDPL